MGEFFNTEFIYLLDGYLASGNKNYQSFLAGLKEKYPDDFISCINHIILNCPNTDLINHALKEINKSKEDDYFTALIDFVMLPKNDNAYTNLKVMAIKILGSYKNEGAMQTMLYCLNNKDSNYKIRLAAAEALGKIGDKSAYDTLSNIVQDENEKSVYVRESAVVALGLLGDTRALDVFGSIINSSQMFLDKFSYFKEKIVEAIGKLDVKNENKALSILKTSIKDKSPYLRISSIETLMNLELNESYDLIYDRLINDTDFEVRKNALIALYNISDRKILDEVKNGDFPIELKECATDIINEYEDDNAE